MAAYKAQLTPPDPDDKTGAILYNLVTYVPDPLGSFLNRLRRQLEPNSPPARSHITVLTPRPLDNVDKVWQKLLERALNISAFMIEATQVKVFENTGVVYLAIGVGSTELKLMYECLNMDGAAYTERHPFHPHITLAQGLKGERLSQIRELASRQWSDYTAARVFCAKNFALVRNTIHDEWIDLKQLTLQPNGSNS